MAVATRTALFDRHAHFGGQVGELQKGTGHQNLEFHLCARPDADLDLSKQLEVAGHHLPERCAACCTLHVPSLLPCPTSPCQQDT